MRQDLTKVKAELDTWKRKVEIYLAEKKKQP